MSVANSQLSICQRLVTSGQLHAFDKRDYSNYLRRAYHAPLALLSNAWLKDGIPSQGTSPDALKRWVYCYFISLDGLRAAINGDLDRNVHVTQQLEYRREHGLGLGLYYPGTTQGLNLNASLQKAPLSKDPAALLVVLKSCLGSAIQTPPESLNLVLQNAEWKVFQEACLLEKLLEFNDRTRYAGGIEYVTTCPALLERVCKVRGDRAGRLRASLVHTFNLAPTLDNTCFPFAFGVGKPSSNRLKLKDLFILIVPSLPLFRSRPLSRRVLDSYQLQLVVALLLGSPKLTLPVALQAHQLASGLASALEARHVTALCELTYRALHWYPARSFDWVLEAIGVIAICMASELGGCKSTHGLELKRRARRMKCSVADMFKLLNDVGPVATAEGPLDAEFSQQSLGVTEEMHSMWSASGSASSAFVWCQLLCHDPMG